MPCVFTTQSPYSHASGTMTIPQMSIWRKKISLQQEVGNLFQPGVNHCVSSKIYYLCIKKLQVDSDPWLLWNHEFFSQVHSHLESISFLVNLRFHIYFFVFCLIVSSGYQEPKTVTAPELWTTWWLVRQTGGSAISAQCRADRGSVSSLTGDAITKVSILQFNVFLCVVLLPLLPILAVGDS